MSKTRRELALPFDEDGRCCLDNRDAKVRTIVLFREVLPGDDDLAAKLAEAEAERDEWKKFARDNTYQGRQRQAVQQQLERERAVCEDYKNRAENAEWQLAELREASNVTSKD